MLTPESPPGVTSREQQEISSGEKPCKSAHRNSQESAACSSIANCNCIQRLYIAATQYTHYLVARFGSALHQKHWHWKHLHQAPEHAEEGAEGTLLC